MPFEELPHALIQDRLRAIRDAPYRLIMDEVSFCASRAYVSKERKRRIRILERKANALETMVTEPTGSFERALEHTTPGELHERIARTPSCIFIHRNNSSRQRSITEGYAHDLRRGTELLFATFENATAYIRAFHARTVDGPQLFLDAIEGGVFSWSKLSDWNRADRISHLLTSIAAATLLTNEEENGIVLAEDEAAELGSYMGYVQNPVFAENQTVRTYGPPQRSHRIYRPALSYPVMPQSHLEPITRSEIDSFTDCVLPYLSKAPLGHRAVVTEAYSTVIGHVSRTI